MTSISLLDEIYDNEKIEKDTFRSMRELSKFTKILSKGNNLYVIIKKKLHQIKLSSPKSLFKISMLLDSLPEENVSFTFYTEEKIENKNNKNSIKQKKNSYKQNNEVNNIYIIDNVDNNLELDVARDISLFDQEACLSPQLILLKGGDMRRFTLRLMNGLYRYSDLPIVGIKNTGTIPFISS